MYLPTRLRRSADYASRSIAPTALITACIIIVALATHVYAQAPWKNVHISAGSGFVTDIVAQPKVPGLFYLRTDVGGFYRWNPASKAWIPISDFLTVEQRGNYGGESIAVDPNSPNTVYIACGNGGSGTIYKSTDRGDTWTPLGLTGVTISGNASMRWGGERLAVQPGNSNVLLFGSRSQGLWRSTDGGANWQPSALPIPDDDQADVQAVSFDPNTPEDVYAAVSSVGIFMSHDSGSTWTNISTQITRPERLTVGPDSTAWVTYNNGVSKYSGGQWTRCTPRGASANAYCGLGINPRNPKNVIVSYGLWGDRAPTAMFETTNAGATWTKLNPTVVTDVPWYAKLAPGKQPGTITDFLFTPISNFIFDPNNPSSVWFAGAGGIYNTSNIERNGGPIFQHVENGHEELCVDALSTPPGGHELIAGVMDVDGFVFDKGIDTYPTQTFDESGAKVGVTCSIAYEEKNPLNMVKLCVVDAPWRSAAMVVTTRDGGFVWTQDKSFPAQPLSPLAVAMSATDPDNIVVGVINSGDHNSFWFYKTHGTAQWNQCVGLPAMPGPQLETTPIAADPIAGGTFYAYVDGAVYRSTDFGRSFQQMSLGTVGAPREARFFKLSAQPGLTGDLWLSEDNDDPNYISVFRQPWEGLYHSRDAGRTWTKIRGITRALIFCFGKASRSGHNTLFYYGRREGDNTDRVYRSTDLGQTWLNIQHPRQAIGDGPWVMEGSRQTFGRVFIGTSGRGIFYSTAD